VVSQRKIGTEKIEGKPRDYKYAGKKVLGLKSLQKRKKGAQPRQQKKGLLALVEGQMVSGISCRGRSMSTRKAGKGAEEGTEDTDGGDHQGCANRVGKNNNP